VWLSTPSVAQTAARRPGPCPVTELARALVDTWGPAAGRDGGRRLMGLARGAVITALRDRRLRPDALAVEIDRRPALPGRAGLGRLVELVRSGSHSELEIWGVQHVLTGPGTPRTTRQYAVALPFATVHLDAAIPELRIAIELDGAAFHGSVEDRERDTRRDAALSALGWVVLRFSYRRLTTDPEGCRREILQVCAARRALLVQR
jgi:very-short-patch-repair endonuclease